MFDCRGKEICLICGATDMRKGIDGLYVALFSAQGGSIRARYWL